jgi:hypothetical protein
MRNFVAVVLVLALTCAHGQSRPYHDANNPSEAVGLIKGTVITSTALLTECSKRFPDLSERMENDLMS